METEGENGTSTAVNEHNIGILYSVQRPWLCLRVEICRIPGICGHWNSTDLGGELSQSFTST